MKKLAGLLVLLGLLTVPAQASWYVFNGVTVDIDYWTGSGANSALLVVDFRGDSFAFGYKWNGSANGYSMLTSVAAGGALDAVITPRAYGQEVTQMAYTGFPSTGGDVVSGIWQLYTGTDGSAWSLSAVTPDHVSLSNGSWQGYALDSIVSGTDTPTSPLPEPGTLGLLAAGTVTLVAARRRRRRA